jgi:hypothetical protein
MDTLSSAYAVQSFSSGAEQCHSVPSPLRGGTGRGVQQAQRLFPYSIRTRSSLHFVYCSAPWIGCALGVLSPPLPCPSPARGERTVGHAPSHLTQCARGQTSKSVHALARSRGRLGLTLVSRARWDRSGFWGKRRPKIHFSLANAPCDRSSLHARMACFSRSPDMRASARARLRRAVSM